MACVIYKGRETLLVDPGALNGMLAQGWSIKPDEIKTAPSTEEFADFMNLHEELKRVSDGALSARDAQILELTELNEQLTEDNEILTAENLEIRDRFCQAMDRLNAVEKELANYHKAQPAVLYAVDEYDRHEAETVQPDYEQMNVSELQKLAKTAKVPSWGKMRKPQLIEALKNGSESTNQG